MHVSLPLLFPLVLVEEADWSLEIVEKEAFESDDAWREIGGWCWAQRWSVLLVLLSKLALLLLAAVASGRWSSDAFSGPLSPRLNLELVPVVAGLMRLGVRFLRNSR